MDGYSKSHQLIIFKWKGSISFGLVNIPVKPCVTAKRSMDYFT